MKVNSLLAVMAIASVGFAVVAKADTVKARCDVYPKGSDRASWSGLCTFSQQQGFVDIQLQKGKSYDLRPVSDQGNNYVTQNGQKVYREDGLGDKGQIYRFANESIFVYWDPAPFDKPASKPATSSSSTSSNVRLATLRANDPKAQINVRSGPTIKSSAPQYGVPGGSSKFSAVSKIRTQQGVTSTGVISNLSAPKPLAGFAAT